MTAALCPGSFDPPTNGHIDVIRRVSGSFDRVVVAVIANPSKDPLFTSEERVALLERAMPELSHLEVFGFSGLLVDFAREHGTDVIIKGLRAASDFDYEMQMAQMNQGLTGVDTFFVPTNPKWSFLSSSLVREVARLGGSVDPFVPEVVAAALKEKLS